MNQIVNRSSEFISEPNLLVPGKKPINHRSNFDKNLIFSIDLIANPKCFPSLIYPALSNTSYNSQKLITVSGGSSGARWINAYKQGSFRPPFTIACEYSIRSNPVGILYGIFGIYGGPTTADRVYCHLYAISNSGLLLSMQENTVTAISYYMPYTISVGQKKILIAVIEDTQQTIYADGRQIGYATNNISSWNWTAQDSINTGAIWSADGLVLYPSFNTNLYWGRVYNKKMSNSEVFDYYKDPHQYLAL